MLLFIADFGFDKSEKIQNIFNSFYFLVIGLGIIATLLRYLERLKQEVATLKEEKKVEQSIVVPVVEPSSNNKKIKTSETLKHDAQTLFAQPIEKGYQVVDTTPKIIMILLETPKANTFIVKDQNAIVYEEDGFWYLSKNDGTSTSLERINIKF